MFPRVAALLVLLAATTAGGQVVPFETVWADSSAVAVTYSPDSVWIMVVTPWKSYTVHGDSTTVASWAARAVMTPVAEFTDTSGVRCTLRLARQSDDPNGPYVLTAAAPGSSSSIVLGPGSANRLISALAGPGYKHTVVLPAPDSVIHRLATEASTSEPTVDSGHPYLVEHLAQPVPGNVMPLYPRTLIQHHVTGVVLVQFVVDTMGRAVMPTVRMLKSPHPLMSFAVFEALAPMRFTPATIGNRKVKELIQQPFTFSVRRPRLF